VPFQGSSTVSSFNYPSFGGHGFYDFHSHREKNKRVKNKTETVEKENYLFEKKYFIVISFNLFIFFPHTFSQKNYKKFKHVPMWMVDYAGSPQCFPKHPLIINSNINRLHEKRQENRTVVEFSVFKLRKPQSRSIC